MNINIKRDYTMSNDSVKTHLDDLVAKMEDNYQLKCEWSGDNCLKFKRSGANGEIKFNDNKIQFTMKVGLLLSAFAPKIKADVNDYMQRNIT